VNKDQRLRASARFELNRLYASMRIQPIYSAHTRSYNEILRLVLSLFLPFPISASVPLVILACSFAGSLL